MNIYHKDDPRLIPTRATRGQFKGLFRVAIKKSSVPLNETPNAEGVTSLEDVAKKVRQGYSVRLTDPATGYSSIYAPENVAICNGGEDREESERKQAEDEIERTLSNDASLSATERDQLIRARRGQGRFREVIVERQCRVTGVDNEKYLNASHIKPWRHSSNAERLDGANGLLLAPHIDFLFDRGLISFGDDGSLIISQHADTVALERLGIDPAKVIPKSFSDRQKQYMQFHRRNLCKSLVKIV